MIASLPVQSVRDRGARFVDLLAARVDEGDEVIAVVSHCAFLKELTGVSLRNGGYCEFSLFTSPSLAACPPAGYFGRFIHTAWSSYGGKPGSVYDSACVHAFQPPAEEEAANCVMVRPV